MAANIEKQQKFMVLRAEGKSFDAIAKRISVSKPTLLKWSKELKDKIEEIANTVQEQFIVEQKIKRTLRAQKISEELDDAYAALSKTDYTNMTKKDLIKIIDTLEQKLEKITGLGKEISQAEKQRIIDEHEKEWKAVPPAGSYY
jgi:predicted RND superfamily exporter protein